MATSAPPQPPPPPPPPVPPGNYFADRRGEILELKQLLRSTEVERDPKRKRDVVRRVIAFDTLGYDCSKLFSEMVLATSTNDLIVKKMTYGYLGHYARANQELATLCINTMVKDTKDLDPMVRGLAVRSLSSLRLPSQVEYVVPVLHAALEDPAPYVRRNGVVGVLKLHHMNSSLTQEFLKALQTMLFDRDANVSSTALCVLDEIHRPQGGLQCDKPLATYLLNRFNEFNEWGAASALELLSRYRPTDQQEMFDAMNLLDGALRQNNSAVVLAATRIFAQFAELNPDLKTPIYLRLKQPLLTLVAASGNEIKYAVLCHLNLLVVQSPVVFEDEFKQFFLKYDEPLYTKKVKLDILPELANEDNVEAIVTELSEYINEANISLGQAAVRAFARIALKIPSSTDLLIGTLLEFLTLSISGGEIGPREEVVLVLKDVLTRHPEKASHVTSSGFLPKLVGQGMATNSSRTLQAVVFMLGEFGEAMPEAPYLLESIVEKNAPADVSVEILVAMLKLFFKRAPEVHGMLKRLFVKLLADTSDTDTHDRTMFYYRLLKQDVYLCANVVGGGGNKKRHGIGAFAEDKRLVQLKEKLFAEFNSLSVLYGKEATLFVPKDYQLTLKGMDLIPLVMKTTPTTTTTNDLLLGHNNNNNSHDVGSGEIWELNQNHASNAVDQAHFQQAWTTTTNMVASDQTRGHVDMSLLSLGESGIEVALDSLGVRCLASGDNGTNLTFYLHASDIDGILFYIELIIRKDTAESVVIVKSQADINKCTRVARVVANLGKESVNLQPNNNNGGGSSSIAVETGDLLMM